MWAIRSTIIYAGHNWIAGIDQAEAASDTSTLFRQPTGSRRELLRVSTAWMRPFPTARQGVWSFTIPNTYRLYYKQAGMYQCEIKEGCIIKSSHGLVGSLVYNITMKHIFRER